MKGLSALVVLLLLIVSAALLWMLGVPAPAGPAGGTSAFAPAISAASDDPAPSAALELERGAAERAESRIAAPGAGPPDGRSAVADPAPTAEPTFDVLVVRQADRRPLPGARVGWLDEAAATELLFGQRTGGLFSEFERRAEWVASDERGRVALPSSPGRVLVRGLASVRIGEELVEYGAFADFDPAAPGLAVLELELAGRVEVSVENERGAPAPGADVGLFARPDRGPEMPAVLVELRAADGQGRAVLRTGGMHRIWGESELESFVALASGGVAVGERVPVRLDDPRTQEVVLRTVNQGAFDVLVVGPDGRAVDEPFWTTVVPPETEEDVLGFGSFDWPVARVAGGRARFEGMEPGAELEARVSDPSGFVPLGAATFTVGAASEVRVRLEAGPVRLSARLLDPDGEPLAEERITLQVRARGRLESYLAEYDDAGEPFDEPTWVEDLVNLEDDEGDGPAELRFKPQTDAEGRIAMDLWHLAPLGRGRLDATFERRFPGRGKLVAIAEQRTFDAGATLDLGDLRFDDRPPYLSGRLVDEAGRPFVGELAVEIDPLEPPLTIFRQATADRATSAQDGSFAFAGAPSFARGKVVLEHPTHALQFDPQVTFPERELQLVAVPGGSLSVTHPELEEWRDVLRLRLSRDLGLGFAETSAELGSGGLSEIGPLTPGSYVVELGRQRTGREFLPLADASQLAEVGAGGLAEVDFSNVEVATWRIELRGWEQVPVVHVVLLDSNGEVTSEDFYNGGRAWTHTVRLLGGPDDRPALRWQDAQGRSRDVVLELAPGEHVVNPVE